MSLLGKERAVQVSENIKKYRENIDVIDNQIILLLAGFHHLIHQGVSDSMKQSEPVKVLSELEVIAKVYGVEFTDKKEDLNKLLLQRSANAQLIGIEKSKLHLPIYDEIRKEAMVQERREWGKSAGLHEQCVQEFFDRIHDWSCEVQEILKSALAKGEESSDIKKQ